MKEFLDLEILQTMYQTFKLERKRPEKREVGTTQRILPIIINSL
jgi:hypothetical protein